MSCLASVRRHISGLPFGELFTTGDLLHLGTRSAVDQAVGLLVSTFEIFRIVRGVFTRDESLKPTVLEVAKIKARRFGKELVEVFSDILTNKFGLPSDKLRTNEFAVNGRTSSFVYRHQTIRLKGVANRKVALGKTNPGKVLLYCWLEGRDNFPFKWLKAAFTKFSPLERADLNRCARLAPQWLTDLFVDLWPAHRRTPYSAISPVHLSATAKLNKNFPARILHANPSECASRHEVVRIAYSGLAVPPNPRLKNWLRFLFIYRRILSHPDPRSKSFAKMKNRFTTSHAERIREIEKFVALNPDIICSRFFCSTSHLRRARSRLLDELEEAVS